MAKAKRRQEYDLDDEIPAYKYVGSKGFWAPWEELIVSGEVIQLDENIEPCEDFEPLNDKARMMMNKFFDKLDKGVADYPRQSWNSAHGGQKAWSSSGPESRERGSAADDT
jgi:hypothetical protein